MSEPSHLDLGLVCVVLALVQLQLQLIDLLLQRCDAAAHPRQTGLWRVRGRLSLCGGGRVCVCVC